MNKLFALVAAVSMMPLIQKIKLTGPGHKYVYNASPVIFPYKNSITTNLFEPGKKPPEAWSQNWMATAQENIRKSEYHFKWEEKLKAYCTPNRKNNLRFFYNDKGFTVEPRTTQIPIGDYDPMKRPDEIKYRYVSGWKVKFNLDKKQFGKGTWKVAENKAEYITKNITVQYINNDEGMRQNFIVDAPLKNTGELKIHFNITTKLKTVLQNNRVQFLHKNTTVLHYEDLKVWDATGKPLEARLKKYKNNRFSIIVFTTGAVYPVTIDPISSTPNSTPDDADQANAFFGTSVASAGDVNSDGYSDVIIGANGYDDGATVEEGRAFVYHGSAVGLSVTPNSTPDDADQANAFFGTSVASAGDVNGDGFSDVIIGANGYDGDFVNEGWAFVYHGSATGLSATPNSTPDDADQVSASFGWSVACAGDVNGDGYSDVIIGAWQYDEGAFFSEGRAFVYHGSVAGLSATPNSTPDDADQGNAAFGRSVASAGDVNGDGYSDVIIGADLYDDGANGNEGLAFVYHGSAAGLAASPNNTPGDANQASAGFGFSVASAGDINADGYSDVIIGSYQYDDTFVNEGRAFVYHGSAAGLSATPNSTPDDADQVGASFGTGVACAGDVNGDGYSDVIIGAPNYNGGNVNEGGAFVYHGSAAGLSATPNSTPSDANQSNAAFGTSVASAGDVNGDGYSDVIIGASLFNDVVNTNEGKAFVYHGSAAGLAASPNSTPDDADQADSNFGYSVASAGDINADGYSDVIIGTPQYDEGANANVGRSFVYHGSATGLSEIPNSTLDETDQALAYFGWSVATAGDINGDGYSDVIIGASQYDDGTNVNEGKAFVYHGSATGVSPTANSTPDDADQAGAYFGISVASAGDVNGDGYTDVIIGANLFNDTFSDEGTAFVYHGSSIGLSATPNSILDDADQLSANFGISVSTAGDVNGDGYSDVIIGASSFDDAFQNEGRAFVYYGSATGVSATPNSTPDDADQANTNFGFSVASAGDINGDGYADVIIGAGGYDDAFQNEGRVFVYHGSAIGLPATPSSMLDDANQLNAIFGNSVAGAGDVNGDGYSDVIIGSYLYDDDVFINEGRSFIYHGSASGLSITPNTTPDDANQANAFFGISVAPAGDINGDGYSDIIIGAYGYKDAFNVGEGRAFVYNGNDSASNKRNNLRLYNSDLITPINDNNFVFGNFGAGIYAKSFLGRINGKMVWETRLNFNPYSGTPITNSTFFTGQQVSYTDMGLTGIELKDLITKILGGNYTKLRARVKYDPVTAITGQVYSPWRNVSSVIDANNLGALPVDLISFKAAWLQKGKTARLDFTTDKENGICCFEIEKSNDGFYFYSIGTVPANNVSGIQSYSFIDNNANGKTQFYRLKIKGIAGRSDYSNIQQLQNNGATEILVFPNPTIDVLQLQLNKIFDKMNVQIINSSGQMVKKLQLAPAIQTISIPVQNLAPGKYWLHLQSRDEKQVLQFVKQ